MQRLREQLRKLEIETEAQIMAGHQDTLVAKDFDPLELDRYSTIQQLSRALAESANDLESIKDLLRSQTTEAESLLVQQSRVTAELQDGLMRTRMVPFERHVPRLTRLVRQVAQESGKRAELAVEGAGGELDRQVLDKMLPPFEHMMRNAVIHGIEDADVRQAAGMPQQAEKVLHGFLARQERGFREGLAVVEIPQHHRLYRRRGLDRHRFGLTLAG